MADPEEAGAAVLPPDGISVQHLISTAQQEAQQTVRKRLFLVDFTPKSALCVLMNKMSRAQPQF